MAHRWIVAEGQRFYGHANHSLRDRQSVSVDQRVGKVTEQRPHHQELNGTWAHSTHADDEMVAVLEVELADPMAKDLSTVDHCTSDGVVKEPAKGSKSVKVSLESDDSMDCTGHMVHTGV